MSLWPIVLAALLLQLLLIPAREMARWLYKNHPSIFQDQVWAFVGVAMLLQAMGGVIGILIMCRLLPSADAHVRWPPARSYAGLAAVFGIGMGLVMLVGDYWPQLLSGTAPDTEYDLSVVRATGRLSMMAITGLAEEIIFLGLLVGMLTVLVPGRVHTGEIDIPVAAVVAGVLFGLAHFHSFLADPLHMAIYQQIYAFVWALIYVWLMERSRSLLAPIVAHGVSNFIEVGAIMLLMLAWG